MMNKFTSVVFIALFMVFIFAACSSGIADSSENSSVHDPEVTAFPSTSPVPVADAKDHVYSDFFQYLIDSGAEKPDYEIYKHPASENGKSDTEIVMSGKFDRIYQFSDLLIIDFLEGDRENPYALVLGTYSVDLDNTYTQMIGKDVCVHGIYLGFSDAFNLPAVTLYDTECDGKIYMESYLNIISDGMQETADDSITLAEFNQIKDGMSYDEVVEIIGKDGLLSSKSDNVELYMWHGKDGGTACAMFVDDRVISKSQAGLT